MATTAVHGPDHAQYLETDPTVTFGGKMTEHLKAMPPRATVAPRLEKAGMPVDSDHVGMLQNDDLLGSVLAKLDELGMADNTLVLYLHDHGVEPGKGTVYEQGVRIPLIMRWPGRIPANSSSAEPVQTIDFLPTFATLAGVGTNSLEKVDGLSLLPVFAEKPLGREALFFESGTFRGMVANDWKYIALRFKSDALEKMADSETGLAVDAHGRDNHIFSDIAMRYYPDYYDPDQLYNLAEDRNEQSNLASDPENAARLKKMKQTMARYLATCDHPYPLEVPEFQQSKTYESLAEKRTEKAQTKRWWHNDFQWPGSCCLY